MKEIFMEAHEELVAEYMAAHPDADEQDAYDLLADAAYSRMQEKYAAMIDHARDLRKEGKI